jgi:hypothetical protein
MRRLFSPNHFRRILSNFDFCIRIQTELAECKKSRAAIFTKNDYSVVVRFTNLACNRRVSKPNGCGLN